MSLNPEEHVREPRKRRPPCEQRTTRPSRSAHTSEGLLIPLGADWRVVDDGLQYILQRRKGRARLRATGWMGRSFCRTREALLRCIREYCGPVDADALQQVRALPEWHGDDESYDAN
jgi:hypothetical protein